MITAYHRILRLLFSAAGINLALLAAADLLVKYRYLPPIWGFHGPGLWATATLLLWTFLFIWRFVNPLKSAVKAVLVENINRIDYFSLIGIAIAAISFYALIYFLLLRLDPAGIRFASDTAGGADMLFFSTLVFSDMGFDLMTPIGWWPRLVALSETLFGMGYLAGLIALLTNRLANGPGESAGAAGEPVPPGPDLVEGTAVAAGTAIGGAVGSVTGPVGTIIGAAIGGAVADESTDRADAALERAKPKV